MNTLQGSTFRTGAGSASFIGEYDDFNWRNSGLKQTDLLCSSRGKVDDAVGPNAAVVDADDNGSPIAKVDDTDERSKRERGMAGCERVLIEDLSAGGSLSVEHIAVP